MKAMGPPCPSQAPTRSSLPLEIQSCNFDFWPLRPPDPFSRWARRRRRALRPKAKVGPLIALPSKPQEWPPCPSRAPTRSSLPLEIQSCNFDFWPSRIRTTSSVSQKAATGSTAETQSWPIALPSLRRGLPALPEHLHALPCRSRYNRATSTFGHPDPFQVQRCRWARRRRRALRPKAKVGPLRFQAPGVASLALLPEDLHALPCRSRYNRATWTFGHCTLGRGSPDRAAGGGGSSEHQRGSPEACSTLWVVELTQNR